MLPQENFVSETAFGVASGGGSYTYATYICVLHYSF